MSRNSGGIVRDERKDPFARVSIELIKRFGPLIGINGLAVYTILAAHVNKFTHRTFVSPETIAVELGNKKLRRTVERAISVLIQHGLVYRESGKLKGQKSEYILRDLPRVKISGSTPLFEDQEDEGGASLVSHPPMDQESPLLDSTTYKSESGGCDMGVVPGCDMGDVPGATNGGGGVRQTVIPNKEEPDRSNQINPTTTETAVVVGWVVEQIVDALAQYVSTVEQAAVEKLFSGCQKICPDATVGEIVYFIHRKGKAMLRMGREQTGDFTTTPILRNPMGFLLSTVPKCFEGAAFATWRKKAADVALKETTQAKGPGELDLLALQPGWTRKVENPWTPVVDALQAKINQHSFDTWFKPTRYAGEIGETLFVAVPSAEFQTIGERYSTEILEAIESLGLNFEDVKFVVPPEVEQKAAGG